MTVQPGYGPRAVTDLAVVYPPLLAAADETAVHGRRMHTRLVAVDLLAVVFASLCFLGVGLVSYVSDSPTVLRGVLIVLGSLAVVGTLAAQVARERGQPEREWYEARAIAETARSLSWAYMMRVPPYAGEEMEADQELGNKLDEVLRSLGEPAMHASWMPVDAFRISDEMREVRALSLADRRDRYLHGRLDREIEWYRDRLHSHERGAARWYWISLVARIAAVGAAGFSLTQLGSPHPLPELADTALALAAAATAWMQLRRHDDLIKGYGLAVDALIRLRRLVEGSGSEESLAHSVHSAEMSISSEHSKWLTRRV